MNRGHLFLGAVALFLGGCESLPDLVKTGPASPPVVLPQQGSSSAQVTLPPAAALGPRELRPANAAQACLAAARALEKQEHYGEAIVEYERARSFDPGLKDVARHLAVLYDRQGADKLALAEYDRALLANPRDADLLNNLGYFYQKRGDFPQAEPWLRRALAIAPRHPSACVNLGIVLAYLGRYDESYTAFATVLKPAEAHSNVGVILAKQGKRDEARLAFHRALALQPDLKQAQAILRVLDNPSPTVVQTAHSDAR
jgi:Tfp pilus assembly protein PilF